MLPRRLCCSVKFWLVETWQRSSPGVENCPAFYLHTKHQLLVDLNFGQYQCAVQQTRDIVFADSRYSPQLNVAHIPLPVVSAR